MVAARSLRVCAIIRLTRPDQVLLIVVVFAVGGLMGRASAGSSDLAPLALAACAVVLVAISVHAANEYADADTDARTARTRFSGGSGAIPVFGLPRAWALRISLVAGAAGAGLAVALGVAGLVPVTATAGILIGLVLGWEYSMPPLALAWRRSGEVTNALLGGLLLPVTGALVAGASLGSAVIAFLPFTLLAFVNLLETQWPDRVADRAVGKNTLASSISLGSVRVLAAVVAVVGYLALVLLPTVVAVASLAALPLSVWGIVTMGRRPPGPSVVAMVVVIVAQGVAWAWLA